MCTRRERVGKQSSGFALRFPVAFSDGLDVRTLRELTAVVEQNLELVERTWHEYFG